MFRIATLNLEQDHKRWSRRREMVVEQIGAIRPDVLALNEVCVPLKTAHWLRAEARARFGIEYHLVHQTRVNGLAPVEAEALLTRYPIVETGNLDFRTRDIIALVARVVVEGTPVDVYVTHLYMSRGNDSLRGCPSTTANRSHTRPAGTWRPSASVARRRSPASCWSCTIG